MKHQEKALCRHGKPVATHRDLDDYADRPTCVRAGDCQCHICSQVCWDGRCLVHNFVGDLELE